MKNTYLKLALSALLLPLFGYADEGHPKTTPFYEYHNRVALFSPSHQTYERIKPDALYWGLEGWLVPTINNNGLLDAEFRMGYNFFYNGVDHLTPFAGMGYIENFSKHHHHKLGIAYGTVGFLYDHEFGSVFNMGINVKGLIGGQAGKKHLNLGSPVIGADIAVPLTLRFGRHRHWDCRIEPFYTYLHGVNVSADYVGFRSTLGYRF
jgi:hypothetical protein